MGGLTQSYLLYAVNLNLTTGRMPNVCVVPGCKNNSYKPECVGMSFYTLPLDNPDLISEWLIKMHLNKDSVNEHSRICSVHFIDGKKHGKNDIPKLFPWTTRRRKSPKPRSLAQPIAPKKPHVTLAEKREIIAHDHCYTSFSPTCVREVLVGSQFLSIVSKACTGIKLYNDAAINTIPTPEKIEHQSTTTVTNASSQMILKSPCVPPFSIELIVDDDKLVRFYTGFEDYHTRYALISWDHLYIVCNIGTAVEVVIGRCRKHVAHLVYYRQKMLVLCRLRLGLFEQDLAFRFVISQATVSRIFITWVNIMYSKFKEVNIWPTREQVNTTMPASFGEYPTTRVIIDATEVFIEQPSSPVAQQQTFSSYKNHNTLKVLIGITPSGAISFVSKLYGGSISDRELTIKSGLLDIFEPGDSVMADKGFTIADLLAARGVSLNIPPMKTQDQLTEQQLLVTRRIASVRIHVERAIKRIKAFKILEVIPNYMAGIADQVFFICSFCSKFQKALV